MMKLRTTIIGLAFLAGAVSCRKVVDVPEDIQNGTPIEFCATSALTKSIASAGPMPAAYTLFVSAYNTDTKNGNYVNWFTAREFHLDGELWKSSPASYWPIEGKLNFLSLAAEKSCLDVASVSRWNEQDATLGVRVSVPDHALDQSELMFASRNGRSVGSDIDMEFAHSQCWLQFDFTCNVDNLIRIDSVVVKEPFTGGTFCIDNEGPVKDAWWDFNGHKGQDVIVPGSKGLVVAGTGNLANILLPEQEECDIWIYYTIKGSASEGWEENSTKGHYKVLATKGDMWWYGVKRIYRVRLTYTEIQIGLTLTDWVYYDIEAVLPD